jgi:tetratricopeptide (TPR) repeat protein
MSVYPFFRPHCSWSIRMFRLLRLIILLPALATCSSSQETHEHPAPERLGKVHFPTSCATAIQAQFDRAVALLHSFAYRAAENAFKSVVQTDPRCAMAHWGIAMTYFHQLWDPPLVVASIPLGQNELREANRIGASPRELEFINALSLIYKNAPAVSYRTRAANYEHAMKAIAAKHKGDMESQVFYALAVLGNASPTDKTHARQKEAVEILQTCCGQTLEHPGVPHYLIHAYDNAELASKGLTAARMYAQIAPSAPHALHMPSHIFTRLGLWGDSIRSNLAARDAAHGQGDLGEELHAMDYLVYAYLQAGRDEDALRVVQQLKTMPNLNVPEFKVSYATTAMPIRYMVERGKWEEAAQVEPPSGIPPQVEALAIWARGLGLARLGSVKARAQAEKLQRIEAQLRSAGNDYWGTQTGILAREVNAWSAQADNKPEQATKLMRQAADEEDALEKLPLTPGPIIPAREQLGDLLLLQNRNDLALVEFDAALANAPGRLAALRGRAEAVRQPGAGHGYNFRTYTPQ